MLRNRIVFYMPLLALGLIFTQSVAADSFNSTMTGYTFMGGNNVYVSTAASPSKTYFLAQPLNSDYNGANYWGYGWVKFDDIGSDPVASARLFFNLLGSGSMSVTPASSSNPVVLDIYGTGDIDVADLAGNGSDDGYNLRNSLRGNLDAMTPATSITMTANGEYSIDITSLYNNWVTGAVANNGLVFSTPDNSAGAKFTANFSAGSVPAIVTASIPEPSTIVLAALAFIGLGIARAVKGCGLFNGRRNAEI